MGLNPRLENAAAVCIPNYELQLVIPQEPHQLCTSQGEKQKLVDSSVIMSVLCDGRWEVVSCGPSWADAAAALDWTDSTGMNCCSRDNVCARSRRRHEQAVASSNCFREIIREPKRSPVEAAAAAITTNFDRHTSKTWGRVHKASGACTTNWHQSCKPTKTLRRAACSTRQKSSNKRCRRRRTTTPQQRIRVVNPPEFQPTHPLEFRSSVPCLPGVSQKQRKRKQGSSAAAVYLIRLQIACVHTDQSRKGEGRRDLRKRSDGTATAAHARTHFLESFAEEARIMGFFCWVAMDGRMHWGCNGKRISVLLLL